MDADHDVPDAVKQALAKAAAIREKVENSGWHSWSCSAVLLD